VKSGAETASFFVNPLFAGPSQRVYDPGESGIFLSLCCYWGKPGSLQPYEKAPVRALCPPGGIASFAQILQPATWNYEVSKKEVKAGETVDLIFTATLIKDWYLYSTDFDPDLGPTVTTFAFTPNDSYQPVGKGAAGEAQEEVQ
jgi:hypothetical protein